MPAPITHIVFAQRAQKQHFPEKELKSFLVGTSLPDIRFLGVLEREHTHKQGVLISDIVAATDFDAGFLFHSFLDSAEANYYLANNITKFFPKGTTYEAARDVIKLLQDELLYDEIEDWEFYSHFFDRVLQEELKVGLTRADVEKWHEMLKVLLSKKPNEEAIRLVYGENFINLSPSRIEQVIKGLSTSRKNKELINFSRKLYEDFDKMFM